MCLRAMSHLTITDRRRIWFVGWWTDGRQTDSAIGQTSEETDNPPKDGQIFSMSKDIL